MGLHTQVLLYFMQDKLLQVLYTETAPESSWMNKACFKKRKLAEVQVFSFQQGCSSLISLGNKEKVAA